MAIFSLTDSVVTNQDIVSHSLELGQVACSEPLEYQKYFSSSRFSASWQRRTSKASSATSTLAA